MFKLVGDASVAHEDAGSGAASLLDQIVRDGARRMLAAVLLADVAAYIESHGDQFDAGGTGWWCAMAFTSRGR